MFKEYAAHGWKLCAIKRGGKLPDYPQWNTKPIPADAADGLDGAGLLHALSGTAALDIDNIDAARPWLAERNVYLDALLADDYAVRIESGRHGRAKLLYRMAKPLRTFKPKASGLELRCATANLASVQDVLPPSIHPVTGKPYRWEFGLLGDWRSLPAIPSALLSLWRELAEGDCEDLPAQAEPAPSVDLEKLRKALAKHSPDCEYDEWISLGMKMHQGTGGAQEGFDAWAAWSKSIKRAPYPGDALLKTHWLSFHSAPGKRVATGAALAAELPAEADEFPIEAVDDAPAPVNEAEAKRLSALDALYERFVFVIWNQEYFDAERNALIGDKAIRHLLTPYMPRKNGRLADPVDMLMRTPKKTDVEAMAFHPGEKAIFEFEGKRYANTFFASSIPEPLEPTALELEKIEWLFNRIDDPFYREWLREFYAHMVQHPALKIRTAPLIWSKTEGNGKSTIAHTIPKLLAGADYYIGVNQSALNSDFNDYLIGKWVVALTEFRAGTRGERAAISKKTEEWIADDMLNVTVKGGRGYSAPNHLVVTASTNADDAAQIDDNNRKWAVHRLNAPPMTKAEKTWIFEEFLRLPRARAVLRHYFMNVPITMFNPNEDAPRTSARQEMIESSISLDVELLQTAFEEIAEPLAKDVVLTREVGDYVRRNCAVKPSNDKIGKILCGPPFNGQTKVFRVGQALYRCVFLRGTSLYSATGKDIMEYLSGNVVDLKT